MKTFALQSHSAIECFFMCILPSKQFRLLGGSLYILLIKFFYFIFLVFLNIYFFLSPAQLTRSIVSIILWNLSIFLITDFFSIFFFSLYCIFLAFKMCLKVALTISALTPVNTVKLLWISYTLLVKIMAFRYLKWNVYL